MMKQGKLPLSALVVRLVAFTFRYTDGRINASVMVNQGIEIKCPTSVPAGIGSLPCFITF